jgi:hypothetical protein
MVTDHEMRMEALRLYEENEKLVNALKPFAHYFDLNDCANRADDDALEIPIRDLRAARNLLRAVLVGSPHR